MVVERFATESFFFVVGGVRWVVLDGCCWDPSRTEDLLACASVGLLVPPPCFFLGGATGDEFRGLDPDETVVRLDLTWLLADTDGVVVWERWFFRGGATGDMGGADDTRLATADVRVMPTSPRRDSNDAGDESEEGWT